MRAFDAIGNISLAALAAAALAASLLTGAANKAQAMEQLTLVLTETAVPLVPNSVQQLAATLGYYEKAGVKVDIVQVQQTPSAIAALVSGSGDMANVAFSSALQLVAREQVKARAIASPDKAIPFVIAARSAIASAADLAGKSFGVGRVGSLDHTMSMTVLKSLGVDTDKIELVAIGQPSVRATALAAGRVDATTMSIGVWSALGSKDGLHVLVSQAAYYKAAPLLSKVNIVTEETLAKKPAAIAAFVKAIVLASRDFSRDPSIWAAAMAKERPDVDRATLDQLAAAYRDNWSVNGGINLDEVAYTTEASYASDDFNGLPPVEPTAWVDTTAIDAVLKEVGVAPGLDAPGR